MENAANPDLLRALYRDMLLIRRFEEKAGQLYGRGEIGGFCHLYVGQEAVAVGLRAAACPGDQVITSHRCHGHILASGTDPGAVMAELLGRSGGVSKGKGGSMHMFAPENGFFGGHGIVGSQVPIGAGLAFANRYRQNGAVCFTCFGDGAADQGQVHEAFVMAALWALPVVFVIENNRHMPDQPAPVLHRRGEGFDIPGATVDGMDVLAVREAALAAADHARTTGPFVLEAVTNRYRGHALSYQHSIPDREARERDPIERLRKLILADGAGVEDIDKAVAAEIARAAAFAEASPAPAAAELWTDIHA